MFQGGINLLVLWTPKLWQLNLYEAKTGYLKWQPHIILSLFFGDDVTGVPYKDAQNVKIEKLMSM